MAWAIIQLFNVKYDYSSIFLEAVKLRCEIETQVKQKVGQISKLPRLREQVNEIQKAMMIHKPLIAC